ncbi:MAG: choice-of-anchor tandem repeat GloVer-containing protein, partial [Candidatus Sulfotelmatobacter sp.]
TACDSGCGAVFEVPPKAGGGWGEKVLLSFNNNNGSSPSTPLTLDTDGNIYGTTSAGGTYNQGNVFKLSRASGGWELTILYSFGAIPNDGVAPSGFLASDAAGNLYGVTSNGGTHGVGTVFKLSRRTSGTWKETMLHNFTSNGGDGYSSGSGVVLDGAGNLYGTTENGGTYGDGTVYEIAR